MFLKSERVSNLSSVVPSVQHFFSGVVVHHGVVAILVCELYVGVPLFACLGVVSKVDGSRPAVIGVDTVNHSTDYESIAHRAHWFCTKTMKKRAGLVGCSINFASTTQPVQTRQQCPAKPPCRLFNIYADMYKYRELSINERTKAPKPDTKTPKNQQVEKTRETCTPDQGSGASLGVLGYTSA